MNQSGEKRSLEKFVAFPYLAWALILLFGLFLYNLNEKVDRTITQLSEVQQEKKQAEALSETQ